MSFNFKKNFLSLGPVGRANYAPGTLGSLSGVILLAVLKFIIPDNIFIKSAAILFIAAVIYFLSVKFIKSIIKDGEFDQSWIVIDEVLGMIIAGLPCLLLNINWWILISAFVLFRIFDIAKPWPIKIIDKKIPPPACWETISWPEYLALL
jgi:phosphatidylglycerophosphatase A